LLIASIFSFALPVLLIGAMLVSFILVGYIPYLEALSRLGIEQILQFLSVFGSGNPFHGVLLIGIVCSLVGALFDSYTFYRQQNLRNN
jgi:type III secretory pathway component EscU